MLGNSVVGNLNDKSHVWTACGQRAAVRGSNRSIVPSHQSCARSEPSFFFSLSKYQQKVIQHIEATLTWTKWAENLRSPIAANILHPNKIDMDTYLNYYLQCFFFLILFKANM